MTKGKEKCVSILSVALLVAAVACVAVRLPENTGQNAAFAAAEFILPQGTAADFLSDDEPDDTEAASSSPDGQNTASQKGTASSGVPQGTSSAPDSTDSADSEGLPSQLQGKTLEMQIMDSGTHDGSVYVKNSNKSHSIDIGQELNTAPNVKIKKDAGPQVLIYHTHTTEAYTGDTRTTDKTRSVCAVGDEIAQQLKNAGINVIHDTTYHDYPAYDGSYDRSKVTMQNYLKKYPGIQVTLDIHRDAMHRGDGTKLKPTAIIGGKKAAQVMIISGCDDTGSLGFPNWECNLRLALRLQKEISEENPGLARPLNFCPRRYNEELTKGSLLIEVGTDVNTLDEAKYSGSLVGKALAQVLNGMT